MEFLALAGGYVLGLAVASFSFNLRCRKRLAEREAGSAEARCRLEQAVERERAAHEATRQRLLETEAGGAGAAEVRTGTDQLRSEQAHLESSQNSREDDVALQNGEPITLQAGHETPSAMPPASDERARDSDSEIEPPMMDPVDARTEAQGIGAVLNDEITRLKAELGTSPASPGGSRDAAPCSDQREPEPRSEAKTPSMEPADDLIRIDGVGPVLKGKLTTLGITSLQQIADFTQADIDRLARALNFRGRIKCENWVEQAKALEQGRAPT